VNAADIAEVLDNGATLAGRGREFRWLGIDDLHALSGRRLRRHGPRSEDVGDVSGNGGYTTPKWFRIRQAGTYYWVASSSGDSNNDAFASGCKDAPVAVGVNTPSITRLLSSSSGK
jgi:hypothetical protein